MTGLVTIETDEISFSDGTVMTTNNFATASDLTSLSTSKQDTLSSGNQLNPNFITAENDDDPVIITTEEFGALTGIAGGSTIQSQIDSKAKLYDVSAPLVKTTRDLISFGQNPILLS